MTRLRRDLAHFTVTTPYGVTTGEVAEAICKSATAAAMKKMRAMGARNA